MSQCASGREPVCPFADLLTVLSGIAVPFKIFKNRRPYNLYCVSADVKPCLINPSRSAPHIPTTPAIASAAGP